jgi:hypothetical protein
MIPMRMSSDSQRCDDEAGDPARAVLLLAGDEPPVADGEGRPDINALTVVHKLWNEDKHRVILDALAIPAEPDASHFNVVADDVSEDVVIQAEWGAAWPPA